VKLEALDGADIRKAKQVLAFEATRLAHGEQEATAAQQSAKKVFGGAGIADEMPTHQVAFPVPVFEVLADSGLCKSRGAARRLIQQGGARIGDTRVTDVHAMLDGPAVVWAGKKRAVRVEEK